MDGQNLMNRMEQRLAEDSDYLARTEKRMSDLKAEIAKQFDKADRLAWLAYRQKEIDAALDLSKAIRRRSKRKKPLKLFESLLVGHHAPQGRGAPC